MFDDNALFNNMAKNLQHETFVIHFHEILIIMINKKKFN